MTTPDFPDVLIIEARIGERERLLNLIPSSLRGAAVASPEEAEAILEAGPVRVLVCHDALPGETGVMFMARTRDRWPHLRRILIVPEIDGELFFHAMREAPLFSLLPEPVSREEFNRTLHHALAPAPRVDASPAAAPPGPGEGVRMVQRTQALLMILLGALALLIAALLGIYVLKSALGIDFFPRVHLIDLVSP